MTRVTTSAPSPSPAQVDAGTPATSRPRPASASTGKAIDGIGHDEPCAGDKRQGRDRMSGHAKGRGRAASGVATPQDHQRQCRQPEEQPVDRDDVAQDALVAARQREQRGDGALQHDRHDRHAGARMDRGDAPEEHPVLGHREVDARAGQQVLAEEAQRRDGDARRNQRRPALAQRRAHHVGGRRGRRRQPGHPQDADAHDVDQQIEHDDAGDADQQPAREIARGDRSSPAMKLAVCQPP